MIEKCMYRLRSALSTYENFIRVACAVCMVAVTAFIVSGIFASTKTIAVFDGETTYTVRTANVNIASAVSSLNLKSSSYNIVSTSVKKGITEVEIEYTYNVFITKGDNTDKYRVSGKTVGDALNYAGFEVDEYDIVEPALNSEIIDGMYIDYTDIDFISGSYCETIAYGVDTVYSNKYDEGVSFVEDGKNGERRVNYTTKLVNGKAVETGVTATTVLSEPVNAKKTIGTKTQAVNKSTGVKCVSTLTPAFDILLDSNGNPVSYKSKTTVRATAYTYTGHNCSTGVAPQPGYIAVNPNVIPYGTKMYIKTADGSFIYGYAVAADTGGFIKNYPTGIDLFMTTKSACNSFGVRNVEVYILE